MTAGRKSKYRAEMLETILKLYEQGKSDAYVCAKLEIDRTTFYRWYKSKTTFRHTVDEGRLLAQCWWEDLGQRLSGGSAHDKNGNQIVTKGNGRVWNFIMINRFRQDYQNAPERQATTDSLDAIREAIQSALGGGK
jgi:hypothetical protein